jgi:hypothetical protein
VIESSWTSTLVGSGLHFAIVSGINGGEAIELLRALQCKIGGQRQADSLFPGRRRPRDEAARLWSQGALREQSERTWPSGL